MKHARSLLLAASALALFISACSQPADIQTPSLEPQFGTAQDDIGVDVAVSSAGGVYVLSDQVVQRCDDTGPQRVLLRRYDSRGNLTWNREIASQDLDYDCTDLRARVLQADAQGNTYTLLSWTGIFDDTVGYASYRFLKYDAAGNLLDEVYIGENYWGSDAAEHENAVAMAVDGSGNVYVAYERGEYDYESVTQFNVVAKYTTNGTLLWQRTLPVGRPYGVTVSGSGSVYVVGTKGLARYTSSGGLTWSKAADNSRGVRSGDIVVSGSNIYTRSVKDIRKYGGSGRQLWLRTQGGLNTVVLQDMDGDGSGNVYLSGKYDAGGGDFNAATRKLGSSGAVLWTKTFGTPAYDDARGIASVTGSELYVTGETQGSLAHTSRGGRDGYLRKLNASGVPLWTR